MIFSIIKSSFYLVTEHKETKSASGKLKIRKKL
jgi:hypothetical protein